MDEVSTIGLDLAKTVFQAHGADRTGGVVFRKKLRRDQLLAFFAAQPPCVVAMEACASAHYWAREIAALGHQTRLIPPSYVKPFVKRQKNDMADAEAICEATRSTASRLNDSGKAGASRRSSDTPLQLRKASMGVHRNEGGSPRRPQISQYLGADAADPGSHSGAGLAVDPAASRQWIGEGDITDV